MRKKIIAGNWKMNIKPSETAALIKAVAEATAQYGDKVEKGEALATLYTSKETALKEAERMYREATKIGPNAPKKEPLVYARVEKDKVEKY